MRHLLTGKEKLSNKQDKRWEFWIDVGGTFTDCLAKTPRGELFTYKILSTGIIKGRAGEGSSKTKVFDPERKTDPPRFYEGYTMVLYPHQANEGTGADPEKTGAEKVKVTSFDHHSGCFILEPSLSKDPEPGTLYELYSGEEAPLTGIRWLKGLGLNDTVGNATVRLGTTRGTNALLEKKGAPVGFVTTRGFEDVLQIAYQDRPRLFALKIEKPPPLYLKVTGLNERLDEKGEVIFPLAEKEIEEKLKPFLDKGITSLAVCLLNSYRNGQHERMVAEKAREMGFSHVSFSSGLVPLQKIVSRGETTAVDAYLTPVIRDYIKNIQTGLPRKTPLKLMTNAGGLVDAAKYAGKDSILSGPAGGVVGYARVAEQAGFQKAIGFDMGGTSTDVSRYHGDFEYRFEMEIHDPASHGGVHLISPMLWIETVAAGGGSVCWFDGKLPRVGPHSAGADPGPACYGKEGPLTVTDINLILGRVLPDFFAFPLDLDAVNDRLDCIIEEMRLEGQHYSRKELAEGFSKIANSTIAAAIKKISLARGYDTRDYVLVAFGGAGPQHACLVARELGIKKVLFHPLGSILSAYGIGMADIKKFSERAIDKPYNRETLQELEAVFNKMEEELYRGILEEGITKSQILPSRRMLDLRYRGQEWAITIECPADRDYRKAFEEKHRLHYGFIYPEREIEIHTARVELIGETEKPAPFLSETRPGRPQPLKESLLYDSGSTHRAGVYRRESLSPGDRVTGPALIVEQGSTAVIDPGWEAEVTAEGNILVTDLSETGKDLLQEKIEEAEEAEELDLVTLELFNNTFSSIAGQMGATLQKTALSTNVKERLDFSCAIFTDQGELVANAPHIPVHLGAMPASVRHVIKAFPEMHPGEVYITNDPLNGGSHLPDVTVVTPVFDETGQEILFFAANRAHHAEIGGIAPGSMPPFARNLAEEGVLIKAFPFVSENRASEEKLAKLLSGAKYPTRALRDNLADINAQVAANQTGVYRLLDLVARYGLNVVKSYMRHIQDAAETMMQRALLEIPPGSYSYRDYLDDGSPLAVQIDITHHPEKDKPGKKSALRGRAKVNFHGTGKVVESSLNANRAIVTSAVLYCFRCLIAEDLPLNEGVLKPISIVLPENCLLNPPPANDPEKCAAVAGGNVETSQRIVDTLFGALQIMAAGQGTMNNLSFGVTGKNNSQISYYETIGGGAGAGNGFEGASAVHTHMTNTRITDPEIVENRYPVQIKRFAIRRGSGGDGRYRGGDGIAREILFLAPLQVSLLTGRRNYPPYGLAGGEAGLPGKNLLYRKGKNFPENLGWAAMTEVNPGDLLVIETPGGGGYGKM